MYYCSTMGYGVSSIAIPWDIVHTMWYGVCTIIIPWGIEYALLSYHGVLSMHYCHIMGYGVCTVGCGSC